MKGQLDPEDLAFVRQLYEKSTDLRTVAAANIAQADLLEKHIIRVVEGDMARRGIPGTAASLQAITGIYETKEPEGAEPAEQAEGCGCPTEADDAADDEIVN